jgi:hypothetical protein
MSRRESVRVNVMAVAIGAAALALVIGMSATLAADRGDALIRNTVRLSLVWYLAAVCQMLWLGPADWRAESQRGAIARWCWTWGLVCFWVHLAMAFHFFHGWSHQHAFERTRDVAGVGEGIFVSYLFTVVWTLDVTWWWAWPQRYAGRSVWIDRTLHAFMLFIVLNGTVVFETGAIRWAGVAGFLVLAVVWWRARGNGRAINRGEHGVSSAR